MIMSAVPEDAQLTEPEAVAPANYAEPAAAPESNAAANGIRRNIMGHTAKAADHGVTSNAGKLMDGSHAADHSAIFDHNVSC